VLTGVEDETAAKAEQDGYPLFSAAAADTIPPKIKNELEDDLEAMEF
jgi:hypothetical protein